MKRPAITTHAIAAYKERIANEYLSDDEARRQLAQLLEVAPIVPRPEWADTVVGGSLWVQLSDGIVAACKLDPDSRHRLVVITIFVRGGLRRATRQHRNRSRSMRRADRHFANSLGKRSARAGRPRALAPEEW